jgi:hypothetical protein
MERVKLLVSFLRLAGQRVQRMPRWAPEWGASLSRREGLWPPSRATTRIESGLGASFGAHSRQQRSERDRAVWASVGVAWYSVHVCVAFEALRAVWRRKLSLCGGVLTQGGAAWGV